MSEPMEFEDVLRHLLAWMRLLQRQAETQEKTKLKEFWSEAEFENGKGVFTLRVGLIEHKADHLEGEQN